MYPNLILVRLKGGKTPNKGLIEVKRSNGVWGGICTRIGWDKKDADVVCRMLGYPSSETVHQRSLSFGRNNSGNSGFAFYQKYLNCVGTEASVFDCPQVQVNCYSHHWAGVKCKTWNEGIVIFIFLPRGCPKKKERQKK